MYKIVHKLEATDFTDNDVKLFPAIVSSSDPIKKLGYSKTQTGRDQKLSRHKSVLNHYYCNRDINDNADVSNPSQRFCQELD